MRRRARAGFALLPVVLLVGVLAAIAFLITHDGAMSTQLLRSSADADEADYVAEAGLRHALWQLDASACGGDLTLASTPFGAHSYSASATAGGATTAASLSVSRDAWVRSDNPTSNNGGSGEQHVRFEGGIVELALTRFDLSSLAPGARINSATAWFYVKGSGAHPEGPLTVHRVTADWAEATVTWESFAASYDSAVLASIPAQAVGDVWVGVNLTSQVQAWLNGEPNFGILLASSSEGTHAQYMSREAGGGQQPRLDVVVGGGPVPPADVQVTATLANGVTRTLTRSGVAAHQPRGGVSVQFDDAATGEDVLIDDFWPIRNSGGASYLRISASPSWKLRTLLRFDVSEIPPGARVLAAQLELRKWSLNAPGTAGVRRVERDWVEGTRNGGGIADGATWQTHDGVNAWTSAGGDLGAVVYSRNEIQSSDTWVSFDIGSLVQEWVDGAPNHGLALVGEGALVGAEFASRETNNPADRPKISITYACECGRACVAPQGTGKVLMVVANAALPLPADAYRRSLLESWGYSVKLVSGQATQNAFDTEIGQNDVVYVSATTSDANVGTKLTNAPIGVVSEQRALNDELGIASGSAAPVGATIDVGDASHYITLPFAAGPLDVYSAPMQGVAVAGTPAPGAQALANWSGAGGLVVLDAGATLSGGGSAAGRRALLPIGGSNLDWANVNANGRLIVQRALAWGAGAGATGTLDVPVVAGNDDAEERTSDGFMYLDSSDLELAIASEPTDTVGIRFAGVAIPRGATITNATVQFQVDEATTAAAGLVIRGQAADDAASFTSAAYDLSSRPRTSAAVSWAPPGWPTVGERGPLQRTPDISALVQEIVNRPGWASGNALVVIVDGTGTRTAESFEGDPAGAAVLHVEYGGSGGGGGGGGGYYLDEFPDFSCDGADEYRGSSGTLDWTPFAWSEEGDDGRACGADLRVMDDPLVPDPTGNRLRLKNKNRIVRRQVDLGGFSSAVLGFAYRRAGTGGGFDVMVSGDGGSSWTVLDTVASGDDAAYRSASYDISASATAASVIAFSVDGSFSGEAYIDDVRVDVSGSGGGGGPSGPGYHEAHQAWSASSASVWQSVDLGAYGVPGGAVVEVAVTNSNTSNERSGGVRAVGSSLERRIILQEAESSGTDVVVMHVQADASGRIEHYAENSDDIGFTLLGYWTGAAYEERFDAFQAGGSGSWRDHKLAAYGVGAGQVAEIVVSNNDASNERLGGVRSFGSSLERRLDLQEAEAGGVDAASLMVTAGAAASAPVQLYAEADASIEFHLLGFWSTPPGTYHEALGELGGPSQDATWQDVDLTSYRVPANAIAQIALANRFASAQNQQGVRALGSAASRLLDLQEAEAGGEDLATLHVQADANSRIQWYHEDVSEAHGFVLLGWWVLDAP